MRNGKWLYDLTGNWGDSLWESLDMKFFESWLSDAYKELVKDVREFGEDRYDFVDSVLNDLSDDKLSALLKEKGFADLASARQFYLENELDSDVFEKSEDDMIEEWATDKINSEYEYMDQCCFDHIDKNDDTDVAINMRLLNFPPWDDEKKCFVKGKVEDIDFQKLNAIKDLPRDQQYDRALKKIIYEEIRVNGHHCHICGNDVEFVNPLPKNKIARCTSCGSVICHCANTFIKAPKTIEQAKEYMRSVNTVSPYAYCGDCGFCSQQFMYDFLKMMGCETPKEWENENFGEEI